MCPSRIRRTYLKVDFEGTSPAGRTIRLHTEDFEMGTFPHDVSFNVLGRTPVVDANMLLG